MLCRGGARAAQEGGWFTVRAKPLRITYVLPETFSVGRGALRGPRIANGGPAFWIDNRLQMMMKTLNRKNIGLLLSVIGPGIIVMMADNDAGGIATYSSAGARYGYRILWILVPASVLMFMVQEMNARMGVVTGKGLADLIREEFSLRLTALIMLAMFIANYSNTVSNFAGIAASSELFGIPRFFAVPVASLLVWLIVLKGNYKKTEMVFLLVSIVYVAYLVSAFLAKPDWGEVAKGAFVPSWQWDASYIIMAVTMIGTTVAPWEDFFQQSSVVDKGLGAKDLRFEQIDTALGSVFLTISAAAIVICCAAAFFNKPGVGATQITSAEQAAKALAPVAGKYASYLFAFGLLFASLFSATIMPLTTTYMVCEAFGWERGLDRSFREAPRFYVIYTFLVWGSAAVILIPGMPLVAIMILSQTINGLILPVILTCMLRIVRNRELMGSFTYGDLYYRVVWVTVGLLYVLDFLVLASTILPIGS